ncbi:diguanylate cyclase, partial [Rhodoferax sp.]|uniref:sensor domain-containing diguanylate cyclase n=1 Tax=Rhodoferax sp. TaxID=50421 RepID=UPI00274315F7|nr:diguanylate cyclase [Rhodoferax sp.]
RCGTITKLNLSGARLLGRERARLIGTKLESYVAAADQALLDGLLEQSSRSGEVEISELSLERKAGAPPAHVDARIALLPDGGGWQIILSDITERKQLEEKLRLSEVRWKLALDAAGDGVWAWNVQTGDVVFSSRFAQLLGYKTRKDLGRRMEDWTARIHPDDRTQVVAAYQAHLRGEATSFLSEHRAQCRDGGWKWVLSRGTVVSHCADGRPLRMIGTYVDISNQKQAEESLRVSVQFQQAVFDSLSAQLAVLDRDGIVIQTNAAWRAYALGHGLAGEPEFVGACYADFLDGMTGKHLPTLRGALAGIAAVASGEATRFQLPQPFFSTRDQRWFSMTVTAVQDAQQRIVVSHEDVTPLKLAELASLALANSDALTGALSRRKFLNLAEQELARASRYQLPLMVLMMDLDNFKHINDHHGHAAGDLVLQGFVKTVSDVLRESDLVGRLGGEEFAVLLPNTSSEGGTALAQRIVERVRASPIEVAGEPIAFTVSIGGGCLSGETSFSALLSLADAALYRAKRAGRDRLELAVTPPPAAEP